MSRSNQFIGLNKTAKLIIGTDLRLANVRELPEKSKVRFEHVDVLKPGIKVEVIDVITGPWLEDDEVVANLHRYTFPSGVVYEEYVQVAPWHSGPCYFIALRRPSGKFLKTTLWSTKETGMSEDVNNYGATHDESKYSNG